MSDETVQILINELLRELPNKDVKTELVKHPVFTINIFLHAFSCALLRYNIMIPINTGIKHFSKELVKI